MKSKSTATLWCFFMGGIGAHSFYLGNTASGVVRLVFCWTFIPAFIALIEFFILLSMGESEFNAKYNGGKSMASSMESASDSLSKLGELYERKLISEAEFSAKKEALLKQIG